MTCGLSCTCAGKPAKLCSVLVNPGDRVPVDSSLLEFFHKVTWQLQNCGACLCAALHGAVGQRPPGSASHGCCQLKCVLAWKMVNLSYSPELIYIYIGIKMLLCCCWDLVTLLLATPWCKWNERCQTIANQTLKKLLRPFEHRGRLNRIVHIKAGQKFLIASQTSSHQYVPVKPHVLRQHIWHKTPSPLVPAITALKSLRKPRKEREHTEILLMIQQ